MAATAAHQFGKLDVAAYLEALDDEKELQRRKVRPRRSSCPATCCTPPIFVDGASVGAR